MLLQSINDIRNIKEINGLTIEEIERRARPISDNTTDRDWRFRSFEGFLSKTERFYEVLEQDWTTVYYCLETTHQRMARHLKFIIQTVEEKRSRENLGAMRPILLEYYCADLVSSKNSGGNTSSKQRFLVSRQVFNGDQYSLFYNENLENSEWNTKWREEYLIENMDVGLRIKVAGNASIGSIDYIERLGFYEGGGSENSYRVDPNTLYCVLTGKCFTQTIELERKKQQIKFEEILLKQDECSCLLELFRKRLTEPSMTPIEQQRLEEDRIHILKRQEYLLDQLQKDKEEAQRQIQHLERFL